MKKHILGFALLLLAAPVQADFDSTEERCEAFGNLAYTVMSARQEGVAVAKQVNVAGDNQLLRQIVFEAYQEPRWAGDEYTQKAAEEYRDKWYLTCTIAMNGEI